MKNSVITVAMAAWFAAIGTALPASAQTAPSSSMPPGMPMAASPATPMVDGEVRKVDKDTKKITLKHAEIPYLEMPGMTMVFQVKDPAMLDMVKAGDKVKFKAQKAGGAFVITEIQATK